MVWAVEHLSPVSRDEPYRPHRFRKALVCEHVVHRVLLDPMNTYAPSGCTFVYGREGELLACLGPEQRPRALLEGMPPAQRVLTGEEIAWLDTWVTYRGVRV